MCNTTHLTGLYLAVLLTASSCGKDDDPVTPAPPAAAACGIAGAQLQATFDGAAWCANASLFASEGGGAITISGITQQGSTLTLELDSLSVGTHAIMESTNALLFTTTLALAYQSTDADPGTLTITAHDPANQRIEGSFSATLHNSLGASPKGISGSFDMYYVQ